MFHTQTQGGEIPCCQGILTGIQMNFRATVFNVGEIDYKSAGEIIKERLVAM
jgi:hypothetical protein